MVDAIVVVTALLFVIWFAYVWCYGGNLSSFKFYRKYKGGIWYRYYPRMYPYMSFWTQDKNSVYSHEIIDLTEDYEK